MINILNFFGSGVGILESFSYSGRRALQLFDHQLVYTDCVIFRCA